jgi:hypothetical protein
MIGNKMRVGKNGGRREVINGYLGIFLTVYYQQDNLIRN